MSVPHPDNNYLNQDTPLPRSSRRRLAVHLLLYVVIFLSGIAVGVGGTLMVVRNRVLHALHHPGDMPSRIADRMQRALSLDDEQTQRVEEIVRQRQARLQDIRREFQPLAEAELDRFEQDVADILNDAQRRQWQEDFSHLREKWVPPVPN